MSIAADPAQLAVIETWLREGRELEREVIVRLIEDELASGDWYGETGTAALIYLLSQVRDGEHLKPADEGRST